jgi:hypothetical protein
MNGRMPTPKPASRKRVESLSAIGASPNRRSPLSSARRGGPPPTIIAMRPTSCASTPNRAHPSIMHHPAYGASPTCYRASGGQGALALARHRCRAWSASNHPPSSCHAAYELRQRHLPGSPCGTASRLSIMRAASTLDHRAMPLARFTSAHNRPAGYVSPRASPTADMRARQNYMSLDPVTYYYRHNSL